MIDFLMICLFHHVKPTYVLLYYCKSKQTFVFEQDFGMADLANASLQKHLFIDTIINLSIVFDSKSPVILWDL